MNPFRYFNTPLVERIEIAVKKVADCHSNMEYHRYMRGYYNDERKLINPQESADRAYEFARLFSQAEHHEQELKLATRKHADAIAKRDALRKVFTVKKPIDYSDAVGTLQPIRRPSSWAVE